MAALKQKARNLCNEYPEVLLPSCVELPSLSPPQWVFHSHHHYHMVHQCKAHSVDRSVYPHLPTGDYDFPDHSRDICAVSSTESSEYVIANSFVNQILHANIVNIDPAFSSEYSGQIFKLLLLTHKLI